MPNNNRRPMIAWKSARARAALAGAVFMLALAAVAGVSLWRAQDMRQRHHSLERRTVVVATLDNARAEILSSNVLLVAASFVDDPTSALISYRDTRLAGADHLDQARAMLSDAHNAAHLAALDELIEQGELLQERLDPIISLAPSADAETRVAWGRMYFPQLWPELQGSMATLEHMAREQQAALSAEVASADRAGDVTLALVVGFSAIAFLAGAAALIVIVRWVLRPLAALQASVRAIASGNLKARAQVGGPAEVACLARDFNEMIDGRRRAEEALRHQSEFLQSSLDSLASPFYVIDANDYTIKMANSVARLGPLSTGAKCYALTHGASEPCERHGEACPLQEVKRTKAPATMEHVHCDEDGHTRIYELHCSPIFDREGNVKEVVEHCLDITDRRRMEEALREQVRRDALTGLLNHGAITKALHDLTSSDNSASCAVAMIDVDGMKAINDTYGHQVGDTVLVTVAAALSKDGAVVGRYGGDEFAAILPAADREAAELYREEVVATLAGAPVRDPESAANVRVSVSVGLAIYPDEADRLEELVKLADSEMYAAKRQRPVGAPGKNLPRPLASEHAARLVGEMVPLLTSPGDLDNKLRLVAHRLSVGAGYDGVHFAIYAPRSRALVASSAFARAPEELIEAWSHATRIERAETDVIRARLDSSRRPIIIEDVHTDERLASDERDLLRAAGLRCALIAPMLWRNELLGSLSVASKQESAFGPRDAQFLMAVATQVTAIVQMAKLVEELQSTSTLLGQARAEAVVMLAAAGEAHDHVTGLHLQNVRAITEALARELGHSNEDAAELGLAAVLHDIGKLRVPESVLSSMSQLASQEWDLMKHHTTWGARFLAGRPGFELAAAVAHWHHESWDGSGYPDGLAGEAIPEAATIVSVADAFDAMTSGRPYRAARSISAGVREIVACSGKQFSPKVVRALARLHRRRTLPRPQQPVEAAEEVAA